MALRLLAGPFPIKDMKGNPPFGGFQPTPMVWYPNVGLLMEIPVSQSLIYCHLLTMDGIFVNFARHTPTLSWWPYRKWMVSMDTSGYELLWEPKTLAWQGTHPDDHLLGIGYHGVGMHRYVKLLDRRIYIQSRRMMRQMKGVPDAPESEDFPTAIGILPSAVYAGRSDHEVLVVGQSTQFGQYGLRYACFYDVIERKILQPRYSFGMVCTAIFYAPEYEVFVTVHRNAENPKDQIRVWSLEVHPTVLSPPEVFEGEPKSGQIVTYRVRLTGSDEDGAEGELVNWWLTGAGFLLDIQSKTDEEGYATARVQYRVGETGESMIEATVLC